MKLQLFLIISRLCISTASADDPIKLTLSDSSGNVLFTAGGEIGEVIELEKLIVKQDQRLTVRAPKGVKKIDVRIKGKQHCQFDGHVTLDASLNVVNQSGIVISKDATVIFSPQWFETSPQ